jgi:hypothetical protein
VPKSSVSRTPRRGANGWARRWLANVLLLGKPKPLLARWYVAGLACTLFAFSLVLLQYGVSEALYGIDGTQGPYS